jgi:hypothetical protein
MCREEQQLCSLMMQISQCEHICRPELDPVVDLVRIAVWARLLGVSHGESNT